MGQVTSVPEYLQDSQRTEDWFKQRIGKFTGSGIKKLMTVGRGKDCKWGDTAKEYVFSKLYERVSNSRIQTPETYAMMKGKEAEEDAIRIFGERTRFHIEPVEFLLSPDVPYIGASPDGLVYDSRNNLVGTFETKCRMDEAMLRNAFVKVTPKHDTFWQLQTEMYVAGVKENYFTHYSPDRECPFDLQIQVVERDDEAIGMMLERAEIANRVIEEAIASVGAITDRRISYITLTSRMIAMRDYVYNNLV